MVTGRRMSLPGVDLLKYNANTLICSHREALIYSDNKSFTEQSLWALY